MNAKSLFDFKFSAAAREEGLRLTKAIGADMPACDGCLSYEVIQDVTDPGHIMVNTLWSSREKADATLSVYQNDAKIKRATELLGAPSPGFVGAVLDPAA